MIDFLNYQIDYNMVTPKYLDTWTNIAGLITGLFFVFIFTPFYVYSGKAAINRCKKIFPDEEAIFVIKSGVLSRTIITFLVGAFLGAFIIPFFVFDNLNAVRQITRNSLLFFSLMFVGGLYGIFFRFNIIYLLTTKRLILISPYKILDCMYKKETYCIEYKDIKSTENYKSFFMDQLALELKNGKRFNGLIGFAGLEKAKKIIEDNLE